MAGLQGVSFTDPYSEQQQDIERMILPMQAFKASAHCSPEDANAVSHCRNVPHVQTSLARYLACRTGTRSIKSGSTVGIAAAAKLLYSPHSAAAAPSDLSPFCIPKQPGGCRSSFIRRPLSCARAGAYSATVRRVLVTPSQVLQALRVVIDPDLHTDIVSTPPRAYAAVTRQRRSAWASCSSCG